MDRGATLLGSLYFIYPRRLSSRVAGCTNYTKNRFIFQGRIT